MFECIEEGSKVTLKGQFEDFAITVELLNEVDKISFNNLLKKVLPKIVEDLQYAFADFLVKKTEKQEKEELK